jgi:hypothetical protein
MFGLSYYRPAEFLDFLRTFRLDAPFCRKVLQAMIDYGGQYTKPDDPFRVLDGYRSGSFFTFVRRYLGSLELTEEEVAVVGSKETFCEEYIPYFLDQGGRVLEILRDPRDILTSLNFGRGSEFGGRSKPHLFNLRQWRKSVAFAVAFDEHPNFLAVRYEDLAQNPGSVMAGVTDFLGLERFAPDTLSSDLRSQSGEVWHSNSSHAQAPRINAQSVGRYHLHLSQKTDLFVQALCFLEMKHLGYELDLAEEDVLPVLTDYLDTSGGDRSELVGYIWSSAHLEEERVRWHRLQKEGGVQHGIFSEMAFSATI